MICLFVFLFFFINTAPVNALNTVPVDITSMNIYEIQKSVDYGYITYEEIMQIYLDRINTYNKNYNAIITLNKNALNEAKLGLAAILYFPA